MPTFIGLDTGMLEYGFAGLQLELLDRAPEYTERYLFDAAPWMRLFPGEGLDPGVVRARCADLRSHGILGEMLRQAELYAYTTSLFETGCVTAAEAYLRAAEHEGLAALDEALSMFGIETRQSMLRAQTFMVPRDFDELVLEAFADGDIEPPFRSVAVAQQNGDGYDVLYLHDGQRPVPFGVELDEAVLSGILAVREVTTARARVSGDLTAEVSKHYAKLGVERPGLIVTGDPRIPLYVNARFLQRSLALTLLEMESEQQ